MFNQARLRIALLYAALMGITLILVTGAIAVLAVRQAWHTDDLELSARAHGLAGPIAGGAPPPRLASEPQPPLPPPPPDPQYLAQQGVLAYIIPLNSNAPPLTLGPATIPGLPDEAAARDAQQAGAGRYQTVSLPQGQVRLYSLPISRGGQITGVVQVARTRYFVQSSVAALVLIALATGVVALALSSLAGFWLADRTLQPIARAMERQRAFTSDASHELRTPLSLIRGNAELLLRHTDQAIDKYSDVVQDLVDEAERLSRLVSNLLTLARSDEGALPLLRTEVDLTEVAASVLRTFEQSAQAKGITLRGVALGPAIVWGDRDRLAELGGILVDNAIRYTSKGEIVLSVEPEPQGAALIVSDTGPGITQEDQRHIFKRFYRSRAARATESSGTGLGLAIAGWIVEAHGGQIAVTSTLGRGSSFRVHLPQHDRAAGSPGTLKD